MRGVLEDNKTVPVIMQVAASPADWRQPEIVMGDDGEAKPGTGSTRRDVRSPACRATTDSAFVNQAVFNSKADTGRPAALFRPVSRARIRTGVEPTERIQHEQDVEQA